MIHTNIDCSNCPSRGSCCGVFPMDKAFVAKHEKDMQVKPSKTFDMITKVAFVTEDCLCVFLNRESKKCSIYDDRPLVCTLYGSAIRPELACPYFKPNGSKRSEASKKQVERHFEKILRKMDVQYG